MTGPRSNRDVYIDTVAMIELRDYHYRRDRMDTYRVWAIEAGAFLRERWDMEGFWIDSGEPPRISGSDPMDPPLGSANVSWRIRWRDLSERNTEWDALWEDPAWDDLWSKHPGFDGYLQLSVRFLDEV